MINPNDVAYPICQFYGDQHSGHTLGLTKREYFAAMAMQGAAADPTAVSDCVQLAEWSIEMADALIAELNKDTK